jgi:outer membrane protein OmpA-like peptidoglycan-associated protein
VSYYSCIPPGKLNESIANVNNLSNNLDRLKFDYTNTLATSKAKERNFQQHIVKLKDSISLVLKACVENTMLSDTSVLLNSKAQNIIYFDFDKFNLGDSNLLVLSNVVDFLKRNDDYNCILQGYTDLEGPKEYNLKLSEKRVLSSRNFLLSSGISANRISGSFFGKTFPNIETSNRVSNRRNRRVEIFLVRR